MKYTVTECNEALLPVEYPIGLRNSTHFGYSLVQDCSVKMFRNRQCFPGFLMWNMLDITDIESQLLKLKILQVPFLIPIFPSSSVDRLNPNIWATWVHKGGLTPSAIGTNCWSNCSLFHKYKIFRNTKILQGRLRWINTCNSNLKHLVFMTMFKLSCHTKAETQSA